MFFLLSSFLLASSSNTNVAVWRLDPLSNPNILNNLMGNKAIVEEVKFSPTQVHLLASVDMSKEVRLWDTLVGNSLHIFQSILNVVEMLNG